MSPGVRRWVQWLFNLGWLLVLILTPVTCKNFSASDRLVGSLLLSLVGAMALVLVTGLIGLFDNERRLVSIVGLAVAGLIIGVVVLFISLVVDLTAAAFSQHGLVEQLLDGLAHLH